MITIFSIHPVGEEFRENLAFIEPQRESSSKRQHSRLKEEKQKDVSIK
jgi:hypothetical protein